jgi:hypothetical protein
MSSDDPVVHLLADLDRPVSPRIRFHDLLLAQLLTELEEATRRMPEAGAPDRSQGPDSSVVRPRRRRLGRMALAMAVVAGTAVAALFASSPWKSAPGFLEEVQAALTPPAGAVLHWKVVMTPNMAGCKVTFPASEYWQDLTPPYNYRGFEVQQQGGICGPGKLTEIGGEWASGKPAVGFFPPNTLKGTQFAWDPDIGPDPMADLRQAIADGFAHREGRTVLDDGRAVERIRQDCDLVKFPQCLDSSYWYVDPQTFKPVRHLSGPGLRPGPGATCSAPCWTTDYVTYESLDGISANRALADIRAQHPDAIER